MLARKADIVRVTKLVRTGTPQRDTVAVQSYGGSLALQVADD
jgi:hypothetical protein